MTARTRISIAALLVWVPVAVVITAFVVRARQVLAGSPWQGLFLSGVWLLTLVFAYLVRRMVRYYLQPRATNNDAFIETFLAQPGGRPSSARAANGSLGNATEVWMRDPRIRQVIAAEFPVEVELGSLESRHLMQSLMERPSLHTQQDLRRLGKDAQRQCKKIYEERPPCLQ